MRAFAHSFQRWWLETELQGLAYIARACNLKQVWRPVVKVLPPSQSVRCSGRSEPVLYLDSSVPKTYCSNVFDFYSLFAAAPPRALSRRPSPSPPVVHPGAALRCVMTSHRVSSCFSHALIFSLLFSLFASVMMGQANVQGRWSTLQTLMPINPIHVALLGNGKVLVVPGSGNCPPSQSGCPSGPPYGPSNNSGALLWDPTTGAITQFSVSWDMFCNAMTLLKDVRALIDGGTIQYDPFYGQPQAAVFDPSTNTFSNTQSMAHGRWYPTVVTLGDGRVMTFSGLNETGGTNTAVEFYTVGSGWSTQYPASWTPDLYPRLHLLPNGKVFYSGAPTTSKPFDPSTTTWNTNVATTTYRSTRTYGTSVLLPLTPANNYDPQA